MAVAEEKTRDLLFCGNHLGKRENTGDEVEDSDDIITLLIINLYLCAILVYIAVVIVFLYLC